MKTNLSLGLAFLDSGGIRRCSFQLLDARRIAVASADYETDIPVCQRFHSAGVGASQAHAFRSLTEQLAGKASVKSLEWAYPTSPLADEYRFRKGGWIAKLSAEEGKPAHAVRGFEGEQFDRALDYVRSLPFPWSPITLRIHPEYAATVTA